MAIRRINQITENGIIAIMRGVTADTAVDVASAIAKGGVTAIEITADTPNVMATIETLSSDLDDVLIGVGTVLDPETARNAQLAGAEFIVTPTVDRDVIEIGNRYGTPVATGAYTPTETVRAYEAGADFVKVFPASTGGPEHIQALRGPLSQIPLVPTGGVSLDNASAFLEAGATALGVGSSIVDLDAAKRGEFEVIQENATSFAEVVSKTR